MIYQVVLPSLKEPHLSNEKKLGWLGYIGDKILPSYVGNIRSHCKDPGFFRGSLDGLIYFFGPRRLELVETSMPHLEPHEQELLKQELLG